MQSVRDNLLNLHIDQETSQQSSLNSYVDSMNQVQALFNETQGTGLQTDLSNFFNSFQSLATDPTSSSLRQATITAGQNLAGVRSTATPTVTRTAMILALASNQCITLFIPIDPSPAIARTGYRAKYRSLSLWIPV